MSANSDNSHQFLFRKEEMFLAFLDADLYAADNILHILTTLTPCHLHSDFEQMAQCTESKIIQYRWDHSMPTQFPLLVCSSMHSRLG